jgi:hypothetical protein
VFHTRELNLVPGAQGARLRPPESTQRSLREVYRRMSFASRAHRPAPGFWATLATNLQLRPRG